MAVKKLVVQYGMGAECTATLPDAEVNGKSAREVVTTVANTPQDTELAQGTAEVLKEIIGKRRLIDVEVARHPDNGGRAGEPIEMDDIVIKKGDEQIPESGLLTLRLSEPYVGGR